VKEYYLGRKKLLSFLTELEEAGGVAKTAYILPDTAEAKILEIIRPASPQGEAGEHIAAEITHSQNGAALFLGEETSCLIIPPFPLDGEHISLGFYSEPLVSLLSRDLLVALVLVRLGSYAVGVSRGEKLISSKVGTGLVHGRHRKGGSSANRFRRHREKQMEYFFTRVCGHIEEHFRPLIKEFDYLVCGGGKTTIIELQKQCRYLSNLEGRMLPMLLDIPEPRQRVLEAAVSRLWASRVIRWDAAV